MNARTQVFELSVEGRQIEEVVESIFHTLLLHRTIGKFHFKQESSYSIGTVGIVDVDCDFIDFTYVRTASDELDRKLKGHVSLFRDTLRSQDGPGSGQISLEFYQKKKTRWLFSPECIPWEVWTIKLDILTLSNESGQNICGGCLDDLFMFSTIAVLTIQRQEKYFQRTTNRVKLKSLFKSQLIQVMIYSISFSSIGQSDSSIMIDMRTFQE
ncbi:autophagy-related protein 101, partial [Mytilus galloprovincialis]